MPTIEIRPSAIHAVLTSFFLGAALWALLSSAAPVLPRAGLGAALLVQLVWFAGAQVRRWRHCDREFKRQRLGLGAGYCRLRGPDIDLELQPPRICYRSEWLMILEFRSRDVVNRRKAGGLHRRLLLWPDSLSASDDWRLRRYLETLRYSDFLSSGAG